MPEKGKPKCRGCQKTRGVGFYVIGDDLENPRPYCQKCIDEVYWKAWLKLSKEKSQ